MEEKQNKTAPESSAPKNTRWAAVLVGVLAVTMLGSAAYMLARINHLEEKVDRVQAESERRVAEAMKLADASRDSQRELVDDLQRQLEEARQEGAQAAGRARSDAIRRAEEVARRLEQEQKKYQQQLARAMEENQGVSEDQLKVVNQGLDVVESDVAGAKGELTSARDDLKRLRSDIGFMSGVVATNAKELATLKKLGDRDYKEFTLKKSRNWTQVATVNLKLRKADAKRHRYSVELLADDRVVEKKDRYVNEPVQFYLTRSKQPYELVINEVTKDQVSGYLAVPKDEVARR